MDRETYNEIKRVFGPEVARLKSRVAQKGREEKQEKEQKEKQTKLFKTKTMRHRI